MSPSPDPPSTLDQATRDLLVAYATAGRPPIHLSTPADARAAGARAWAPSGSGPAMREVDEYDVPSVDGAMRVRVLVPPRQTGAVMVYLHGGGWVLGDIDGYDVLGRELAVRSGATVVLANYRKAPEHPFPVPVEDAWAALRWADARRELLAGRPDAPLFVGGDSAGGNLAAVTALRARDGGGPRIARQLLVYPITDCDQTRPSYRDPANQLLLGADTMAWFFDHYVGDGDRTHPEVSPLRAADLSGLAPATVVLAGHDPLHDEGRAYADRMAAAGVDVDIHTYPDQLHGFLQMVGVLPASAQLLDLLGRRIRGTAGLATPGSAG